MRYEFNRPRTSYTYEAFMSVYVGLCVDEERKMDISRAKMFTIIISILDKELFFERLHMCVCTCGCDGVKRVISDFCVILFNIRDNIWK